MVGEQGFAVVSGRRGNLCIPLCSGHEIDFSLFLDRDFSPFNFILDYFKKRWAQLSDLQCGVHLVRGFCLFYSEREVGGFSAPARVYKLSN